MLSNRLFKFIGLACALLLAAGCQQQGVKQTGDVNSTKTSAGASAPIAVQRTDSSAEAEQVIIAVHLAQLQAEPDLLTVDLGEDKKLYALPRPVLSQADIQQATPVTNQEGKTFVVFDLTEQGGAKLAQMSAQTIGHFFLVSVQRQLVGVLRIDEPMTTGQLVMATENEQHTEMILQLLR